MFLVCLFQMNNMYDYLNFTSPFNAHAHYKSFHVLSLKLYNYVYHNYKVIFKYY